ncbi:MAG: sigma-70 family RNA polymerase sigma factor [Nannocystaceae bacterium]|jgi:RNA polymerase sigma-70 factor (ECF subfamily)
MATGEMVVASESSAAAADGFDPKFESLYRKHHAFVWRSVRRLGVPDGEVDDLVQEVFVVVHRRLGEFEGRSSITTWLFGIAYRVVRDHRRSAAARARREALASVGRPPTEPEHKLQRAQAAQLLDQILDGLDEDQRSVFVMAEVVHMTAPEIAELTGAKLNTVYSRLRLARRAFEQALAAWQAEHAGEAPWTN